MARPILGKKKDCDIRVRIDSNLNEELLSYCEQNETDKAKVIRFAIEIFLQNKKGLVHREVNTKSFLTEIDLYG